jgi:hypothetical protein
MMPGCQNCAMTKPLDPDHLAALIEWRVAELRVLAAQTAVDFAREQPPARPSRARVQSALRLLTRAYERRLALRLRGGSRCG